MGNTFPWQLPTETDKKKKGREDKKNEKGRGKKPQHSVFWCPVSGVGQVRTWPQLLPLPTTSNYTTTFKK